MLSASDKTQILNYSQGQTTISPDGKYAAVGGISVNYPDEFRVTLMKVQNGNVASEFERTFFVTNKRKHSRASFSYH